MSEKVVRLVAPVGWYLLRAEHTHERHAFAQQTVKPLPFLDGPWRVEFQKLEGGGCATYARGRDLCEAWENAQRAVMEEFGAGLPDAP